MDFLGICVMGTMVDEGVEGRLTLSPHMLCNQGWVAMRMLFLNGDAATQSEIPL